MKLYAETAAMRARQLLGDLAVLVWVAAWVAAGLALYRLVEKLAGPGRTLEQAGAAFAGDVSGLQEQVGRVPAVGDDLQEPFGRLGGLGRRGGRGQPAAPGRGRPGAVRHPGGRQPAPAGAAAGHPRPGWRPARRRL